MRLLLDTHIAVWALTNDRRLGAEARALLLDPDNHPLVSVASIWEIAIKHGLRRNAMPFSGDDAMRYFREAGFEPLSISAEHAAQVEQLPSIQADPFDRLLIAQAIVEPLHFLTHDALLARYGERVRLV
jgi:PIN domain nuclease of toxin-antitoxin system